MLKLKLQFSDHLMPKNRLIGKDPDAGKDEVRRRKVQQRMKWLDGIINSMGVG